MAARPPNPTPCRWGRTHRSEIHDPLRSLAARTGVSLKRFARGGVAPSQTLATGGMTDKALERQAQARVGSVLRDKYRLERVLGIGGMAAVYSAVHRNQARFAIKMLHADLSEQKSVRRRFLREGYVANSVKHAGRRWRTIMLDDDVAEDGSAFLVMELLDGISIEELWDRCAQRLASAHVVAIVDPLLEVLAAAHANGVVHRDIKPANVFVTREGQIKVLDFGIGRVRDAVTGTGVTSAGTVVGTPAFMSPTSRPGASWRTSTSSRTSGPSGQRCSRCCRAGPSTRGQTSSRL